MKISKLLEEYIKFSKKNESKMQQATSIDAYDSEQFFECFYDAANDRIYLHCHYSCEIETAYDSVNEFKKHERELEDELNKIVDSSKECF